MQPSISDPIERLQLLFEEAALMMCKGMILEWEKSGSVAETLGWRGTI